MNKTELLITKTNNNNCRGRCLLEMQKTLDVQVIAEFLETVRDFYNDDNTASEMKNIIISQTNEIIEMINKKASDMCSFIDEVFLHQRQRQSSFYRLCHKLARKATPEGSCLPDESKCICFSEENLKMYDVDSVADSKKKLIFNLKEVKEAVGKICGKLLCTKCERSTTFGCGNYSMNPDCNCTVPTFSSQHKIHEAILDICLNKDPEVCNNDSWYLTHLQRDADYYKQKSSSVSISSDNSIDSFEIISPDDVVHLDNDISTGFSNLNSTKEKVITGHQSALPVNTEFKVSDSSYASTENFENFTDSAMYGCEFLNKLRDSPVCSFGTELNSALKNEPIAKSFEDKNMPKNSENCRNNLDDTCVALNKPMPSDIVKQSFSNFLNNSNISKFSNSPSFNNSNLKVKVCHCSKDHGVCLEKMNTIKASVNHPLKRYLSDEASIDHPLKSLPSDVLKNAFSSYFDKENNNKWLLK